MCITDRAPAQTRVAARFPRGALILFLASETENSFSTFAEGENAPQVDRSYPNAARDRPRCRRGGRGGRSHAQGARTECHGERGARDPPFFPLETENSNNYWYLYYYHYYLRNVADLQTEEKSEDLRFFRF